MLLRTEWEGLLGNRIQALSRMHDTGQMLLLRFGQPYRSLDEIEEVTQQFILETREMGWNIDAQTSGIFSISGGQLAVIHDVPGMVGTTYRIPPYPGTPCFDRVKLVQLSMIPINLTILCEPLIDSAKHMFYP